MVDGRTTHRAGVVSADEPETGAQVRATAAESARQLRGVLAELAEPDSEITAHPGTRTRLEGAAMALESIAANPTEDG